MDELSLVIVGIDYPNDDASKSNRRMELMLTTPGDALDLRFDPKNPYDSNAIAVFSSSGIQVCHLSAERAPWIGKRMQSEEFAAIFQALDGPVAYLRIRFGGGMPRLPLPAPSPAPPRPPRPKPPKPAIMDPDAFYPDEEGPEWGA